MTDMRTFFTRVRRLTLLGLAACQIAVAGAAEPKAHPSYAFDRTISREVLENYLARSISVQGVFAWNWVRKTDSNGWLQMPGSRTASSPDIRWYFANNPSPAVPNGLGNEDAIRAVWTSDADTAKP